MKILDNEKIVRTWLRKDIEVVEEIPCPSYNECLHRFTNTETLCGGFLLHLSDERRHYCPFSGIILEGLTYIIPEEDLVDNLVRCNHCSPTYTYIDAFINTFDLVTGRRKTNESVG